MKINELVADVKELLDEKGFAYDKSQFWEKVALAHTEISELADVVKKKGMKDIEAQIDIEHEVADIIIRTVNFALMFDFDLEQAIQRVMDKNWKRPTKYNTVDEVK